MMWHGRTKMDWWPFRVHIKFLSTNSEILSDIIVVHILKMECEVCHSCPDLIWWLLQPFMEWSRWLRKCERKSKKVSLVADRHNAAFGNPTHQTWHPKTLTCILVLIAHANLVSGFHPRNTYCKTVSFGRIRRLKIRATMKRESIVTGWWLWRSMGDWVLGIEWSSQYVLLMALEVKCPVILTWASMKSKMNELLMV